MKDIKHLDESITQYEEMHARQDLQAFKELLAATKSLLAEHSSRDRSMGSYQVGDFLQLSSINRFMLAAQQSAIYLNDHMPQIQAAQDREKVRVYAEERTKQGLMNLVFGVLTVLAGFSALAMSGGTALPIVAPMLKITGVGMYLLGSSNSFEGAQNIILGSIGDGKTVAFNPIRDTIFFGNAELYNHVGQVFTLTTGVFIPIAKTKSIAQGLSQFFWGTVGGLATGQAAYHGTKLLGGNEDTAQLMNLLGNFVGGYAASKAANKFSLNKVKVDVEVPKYNREQIPRNIEESRPTWRQSELDVGKDYEGYDAQKSFINGEEVPYGTKGSVRPEFYKNGHSVEVKNYNVETSSGRNSLINNVSSQIKKRLTNLPEGTEQTVVIDVRGQDYNLEILRDIKNKIIEKSGYNAEILFKRA